MGERIEHGWVSLGNGAEVHLDHGVPTDVCMMHAAAAPSPAALAGKIADLTGLRVSVGEWRAGETAAERLAAVRVSREHLNEVLRRLALASARVFVDYYHKAVDDEDPDWDPEEFAVDFSNAMKYCGVGWSDVDPEACFKLYREVMRAETARLAAPGK
mgnify:CR=1 FL=1